MHTRLTKGPRGFGFNIVGGSKPGEFLQVYSVTTDGPSNLKTGEPGEKMSDHTHTRTHTFVQLYYLWMDIVCIS